MPELVDSDPYAGLYYPELARKIDDLDRLRCELGLRSVAPRPRPKLTVIQGGKVEDDG